MIDEFVDVGFDSAGTTDLGSQGFIGNTFYGVDASAVGVDVVIEILKGLLFFKIFWFLDERLYF